MVVHILATTASAAALASYALMHALGLTYLMWRKLEWRRWLGVTLFVLWCAEEAVLLVMFAALLAPALPLLQLSLSPMGVIRAVILGLPALLFVASCVFIPIAMLKPELFRCR
ncbi:hypothetical protein [Streptomyces sp. NPDC056948]|uniref:hypothetical protein n=1 Tax=Streptomyces sp. NPDC056948 TaxID=3345975 RepID=UPI0036301940